MKPRQEITDQFSTFLRFADSCEQGWAIDPHLRRSMQTHIQALQNANSEAFWSIYWHQEWLTAQQNQQESKQRLSQAHLSAYLQEPCYWAAQGLIRRIAQSSEVLCECFQMAIAKVPKVLRSCDPNHAVSFKTYSQAAFENIMRDGLRQQYQINRCNDWALLLRTSTKQVREALQQAGLVGQQIEPFLKAYECYANGYWRLKTTARQRVQRPDPEGWQVLLETYQQQFPGPVALTADTLESQLQFCAARVRSYLYPTVVSLNAPRAEQLGEWQDDLPTPLKEPMAELIVQEEQEERRQQQAQLTNVLTAAIAQLAPPAPTLLSLYYRDGLTQQQIAEHMGMQQYTVSRRLSKARAQLLLALTQWQSSTLHKEVTSTVMKYISALLEEWLHSYYRDPQSYSDFQSPETQFWV